MQTQQLTTSYLILMNIMETCIEQIEITVILEARARGEVGS